MPATQKDAALAARAVADLFPQLYLHFHRRLDRDADRMTPQSAGVLQHLAHAGPLTIGELAQHLDRAQSVVSETVEALEARGLLARMRDERDRRRTLVWLTDAAHQWLRRQQEVLDPERLAIAMQAVEPTLRVGLVAGLEALLRAAQAPRREPTRPSNPQKKEKHR